MSAEDVPGWLRVQREAGEEPEKDEAAALARLRDGLGAVENAKRFIIRRRAAGTVYSRIAEELTAAGIAHPQGRAWTPATAAEVRWEGR